MAEESGMTFWGFIKGIGKFIIGLSLLLQSLLFLILMVAFFGVLGGIAEQMGSDGEEGPTVKVPEGSALVLNPSGVLVEQAAEIDPFEQALQEAYGASSPTEIEVHDVIRAIRAAKEDENIKALVLDLGNLIIPSIYASKMHYVADELKDFRDSGKPVIAVGDGYSQEQYYLAANANEIFMHDYGAMFILGYGRYRTYQNEFINKLKITNHVFRVGTFKSALEPYLLDEMSEPAKEANRAYLDVLWRTYIDGVEEARELPQGTIENFANNLPEILETTGGDLAKAALETGLVDALKSREEQKQHLIDLVGKNKKGDSFKGIGYRRYLLSVEKEKDGEAPNVAVVTAAGTIVDGEQPVGVAGGDTIAKLLRKAREDDDVKAIVLRVDSGGGSAFASEVIRKEVVANQEAGKPVVVSMGSLAASGGYWIAADADEIWAAPTTITGSIGIFGFFQTFENTADWAGVHVDGVGTTDLSSILGAGIGPLPEEFGGIIQASIENGYNRFLGTVGGGRDMTNEEVDAIGQGRVWVGEVANTNGLVDNLGDFDDALAAAARLAGIEGDYDVVGMDERKTRFEMFIEGLSGAAVQYGLIDIDEEMFGTALPDYQKQGVRRIIETARKEMKFYDSFNDPNAIYARCLECEF